MADSSGTPGADSAQPAASSSAPAAARVVLGVSGGIAAYKACELLRRLRGAGHQVTVVPTAAALRFVGAATFEALSGEPVSTDVFSGVDEVRHVQIGQRADLVIVAPATADLLAKAAGGLADDLLTATLLVTRAPVLMAPAMHTEMWTHPATVANVAILRDRGVTVVPPAVGRLTGPDSGAGRLPDPLHLAQLAELALAGRRQRARDAEAADPLRRDLAGRHVVVTAGGTREPLDPVRFLGNRSSGKQGFAVAMVAAARGAQVTLIAANCALTEPPGVHVVPVSTAAELQHELARHAGGADAVVMAAAIADYRPERVATHKIKKTTAAGDAAADPVLTLVRNPDILAGLVADRGQQPAPLIVGFAAETGDEHADALDLGRQKLRRKGCDLLVVNRVGADTAFEVDDNAVTILSADGTEQSVALAAKSVVAAAVCDAMASRLPPLR